MKLFINMFGRTKNRVEYYINTWLESKDAEETGNKSDYRGQIPNKVSIEQRPMQANNRERFGDFEVDTIIGANHKGAILTMVDRKLVYQNGLIRWKTRKSGGRQTIKPYTIFDLICTPSLRQW
ncbi:MAG: hypothetical protein IPM95_06595 [Sphingobacteriales bacterium]|nr:hypothetical protein [Sphingobacteriales bacterium]